MTETHDIEQIAEEIDTELLRSLGPVARKNAPVVWYGGKGLLAHWIMRFLPPAQVYCEPFAGGASVFWRLPHPYPVEVLNDLDDRIINLYRVLQDPTLFRDLLHRLIWTPYSQAEFTRALRLLADPNAGPVERAWAVFVSQNQAISGAARSPGCWGRNFMARGGMVMHVGTWRSHIAALLRFHDRISRVFLDSKDAMECIAYWDTPDTLFYCDPPYHPERLAESLPYAASADADYHRRLVAALLDLKGMAVVSGYDHPDYAPLVEAGWHRVTREYSCSATGRVRGSRLQGVGSANTHVPRTECLWISPRAMEAKRGPLL